MKQILLSLALLTATILSAKVQKQILPIDPVAMEVDGILLPARDLRRSQIR